MYILEKVEGLLWWWNVRKRVWTSSGSAVQKFAVFVFLPWKHHQHFQQRQTCWDFMCLSVNSSCLLIRSMIECAWLPRGTSNVLGKQILSKFEKKESLQPVLWWWIILIWHLKHPKPLWWILKDSVHGRVKEIVVDCRLARLDSNLHTPRN